MRRAPLAIAGTIAGTAAVLAFPVETSHVNLTGSGASAAGSGASTGSTTPTSAPAGASSSSSPTTTTPTKSAAPASATGAEEIYPFGQLSVAVTITNGRISAVTLGNISERDQRSAMIDEQAVPQLEHEVISVDSATVDGVSGATYTSDAFIRSLATALKKLGFT